MLWNGCNNNCEAQPLCPTPVHIKWVNVCHKTETAAVLASHSRFWRERQRQRARECLRACVLCVFVCVLYVRVCVCLHCFCVTRCLCFILALRITLSISFACLIPHRNKSIMCCVSLNSVPLYAVPLKLTLMNFPNWSVSQHFRY